MKKLKPWLIAFGIVVVVAIALYFSDNSSTFRKSQIDFAVHDGSDIHSIVIIHKSDTLILNKQSESWIYNNMAVARKEALINLIRLLSDINAKAPIRGNFDDALKNGAWISLYDKDELIKQYIIAEDTVKHISIGQMVGSDKVFEVEVVGYPPRILPFYRTDNRWWRDKVVFRQNPEQIVSIAVKNASNPDLSYTIRNYGKGRFGIMQGKSDKLLENILPDRLKEYLSAFTNIEVSEYFETDSVSQFASPLNLQYTMTIQTLSGNSISLQAFEKTGDPNQLYILINNSQLALGKYVVFDLLFKEPLFFCK